MNEERHPPDPPRRPLQIMELLVLATLADGPLHGYGLVTALSDQTDGRMRIRPGNLYRVLDRLTDAGLLSESVAPPAPARGAERTRLFAITPAGLERAAAETRVLTQVLGRSPALSEAVGLLGSTAGSSTPEAAS